MATYPAQAAALNESGRLWDLIRERLFVDLDTALDIPVQDQGACEDRLQALDISDIRASLGGNPEAYRRLVERHQDYVSKILWRFSRDRQVHEELVQDVFVEAYLGLGGFKGRAPFPHWLSRIAIRVGYHYWKQTTRQHGSEGLNAEQWHQVAMAESHPLETCDAAALVHKVLGQLPPRDRLVLTLRYLEDCDVAETARRVGWTRTMVKVQTLRAKKKLEKLLGRYEREALL